MTTPERPRSYGMRIADCSDVSFGQIRIEGVDVAAEVTRTSSFHVGKAEIIGPAGLTDEQFEAVVNAVRHGDPEDPEGSVRRSRIGRWLAEQRVVEWGSLVAAAVSAANG